MSACVQRRGYVQCRAGAEANDRGEYRITGLAPGAYLVVGTYKPEAGLYPTAGASVALTVIYRTDGSLWHGEIPPAVLDAAVKLKVDARGSHHVMLKPVKAR